MSKRKISNASGDRIPLLYHYQPYDEEHLSDLLRTKRARCSNIANVNDPWDCTMAFKLDDGNTARRTASRLRSIAQPTQQGSVADAAMDWALANDPQFLSRVTRMIAENSYKDAVEWRRLYCLTRCVDSTLMWSHYAQNHKGICLEFAVKPDNVFATAFKVIYEEDFISGELFSDADAAFLPFIVKAKCWEYEQEYRLFLRIHDPEALHPFPEVMRVVDNRFNLPDDGLTAIVLGCCTPREVGIRIQQLIVEHWPSISIKKMLKQHDRYKLQVHNFDPRTH